MEGNDQVTILGHDVRQVIARLDALLMVLKSCKGAACIKPWAVLHPNSSVDSLQDALHKTYNTFYHKQPKVAFDRCGDGYILGDEGPQEALAYRRHLPWYEWV